MREAVMVEADDDDSSEEYESEEESQEEEDPETWEGDDENPGGQSGSNRPQPAKQQSSKREINPNFQDVRQTGKWGSVSKKEMYIVLGLIIAVIIGVIVVVVVILTGKDDGDKLITNPPQPPAPTTPPTMAPTKAPTDLVLASVRDAIAQRPAIAATLDTLPVDADSYEGIFDDPEFPANARAMSWVLHEDPMQPGPGSPELATRYAAATLYYSVGGPGWLKNNNWITGEPLCTWDGLFCDVAGRMNEVVLGSNGLAGELPNEVALFQDVEAFDVRRNALTGPLPGEALHEIPRLTILYVDNNQLTGDIPKVLGEGVLTAFFSQNNNFSRGFFPSSFCGSGGLNLTQAGISCKVTTCLCCDPVLHCF